MKLNPKGSSRNVIVSTVLFKMAPDPCAARAQGRHRRRRSRRESGLLQGLVNLSIICALGLTVSNAQPQVPSPSAPPAAPQKKKTRVSGATDKPAGKPGIVAGGTARRRKKRLPRRSPSYLLARSTDPLLRETAAQVLGQQGNPATVPLLIQTLRKDDNLWVRARSAEALGLIGSTSAISALRSALDKEKNQQVRLLIAKALVRLGQSAGVHELLWQLKTGANYLKAEAMAFLVSTTGQPLGQDVDAWWHYFNKRGFLFLARRPLGSPGLFELRQLGPQGRPLAQPLRFWGRKKLSPWQEATAVVLDFPLRREPITLARLRQWEKEQGPLPDHALILLHTRWHEAEARYQHRQKERQAKKTAARPGATKKPGQVAPRLGPGLELEAAQYLLQQAPHLLGVGIDAPALDVDGANTQPARKLLLAQGRWVLEQVADLERLQPHGTRLILFNEGAGGKPDTLKVHVLALLP